MPPNEEGLIYAFPFAIQSLLTRFGRSCTRFALVVEVSYRFDARTRLVA